MDVEFWAELSAAICDVDQRFKHNSRDTHRTSQIARVHLWSVLHDRPTCWACQSRNWTDRIRPTAAAALPDQSTMSRRMKRADFDEFLALIGQRLNGRVRPGLLKVVDGKPLELPNHTSDRDAAWGRGVSRQSVGYKLHAICSGNPMPDAFAVTSLDRCEKRMAYRMIKRIDGTGYLLADAHFDASWLFDGCRDHDHQLLCPRAKPNTALGHHYQSPDRIRAIEMLESPAQVSHFGPSLYQLRTAIERDFSQLVCFGGGLTTLPSWVRRIWRVRRWVTAKLLINAARIRIQRKKAG